MVYAADKTILFYTVYCSIILYVLLKQMKCHAVVFLLHAMITSWLGPCVCLCGGGVRFGKNRCKYFDKSDFRWQGKDKFKAPILTLAGCYQKYKYFDRKFH